MGSSLALGLVAAVVDICSSDKPSVGDLPLAAVGTSAKGPNAWYHDSPKSRGKRSTISLDLLFQYIVTLLAR